MSAWLRTNIEVFENGFLWVSVLKRERKLVAQEGGWELSLWKIHLDFIHENGTPTRSHQLFLCRSNGLDRSLQFQYVSPQVRLYARMYVRA